MKTRAALTGIFASIGILVVGWQFGTAVTSPAPHATASSSSGSGATGATTGGGSGTSSSGTATPTSTTKDGTYTGTSEPTRFGNVQVKVVVNGGKIADIVATQLTDDGGRSVQISNYAAPILRTEALQAQSANVSSVSGATYTSEGYLSSLQSALDQAGF